MILSGLMYLGMTNLCGNFCVKKLVQKSYCVVISIMFVHINLHLVHLND